MKIFQRSLTNYLSWFLDGSQQLLQTLEWKNNYYLLCVMMFSRKKFRGKLTITQNFTGFEPVTTQNFH
jgi:hypothetical protein